MIVFLHGWGMSKAIFDPFVDSHLNAEEVLLLDLPGYGDGEWIGNFDAQVSQLFHQIPKGAHLIAWSLGGLYALRLSALFPEHLSRLTMVCSTPCFAQKDDFKHAMTQKVLNQFSEQLVLDRKKTINRFLLLQLHGQAGTKEIAKGIRERVLDKSNVRDEVLEFGLTSLKEIDCREDLKKCKAPLLFVLGKRDKLVPYLAAESIRRINPDIDLIVLDGVGHLPFVTHEKIFLNAVFEPKSL